MGKRVRHRVPCSLITILAVYLIIFLSAIPTSSTISNWWDDNVNPGNYTYRSSFPSPSGGIIYRNQHGGRRHSRNSNTNDNFLSPPKPNYNKILVGEICDPEVPLYNRCTNHAHCIPSENNLHRCNCTQNYEETSDKKCHLAHGQQCDTKEHCNHEAGLLCIDSKCQCENSDLYQTFPGKSCRSKVGGPCTPPATHLGVRFSRASISCVKNAMCKSFGPNGLSFRCVCKPGYVENRFGYCAAGVGMACSRKGDCDSNIPLVCKQGICSCRDSIHVYDPSSNSCLGLAGAQCCTDPEGQRCISALRTGCVEGSFCQETSMNLPGSVESWKYPY